MKEQWSWVEWINEFTAAIAANLLTFGFAWAIKSQLMKAVGSFIDACRKTSRDKIRKDLEDKDNAKQEY